MIRLDIQPYCESCMDFEADVEKPVALYADFCLFEQLGDTVIRCEHRRRCAWVMDYAEKHTWEINIPEKKGNEDA